MCLNTSDSGRWVVSGHCIYKDSRGPRLSLWFREPFILPVKVIYDLSL